MKKYILFILLLYSICAQSQISRYDSLNIQYAEELIKFNSQFVSLPYISKYMVFISSSESMITFVDGFYCKTLYYRKNFYYENGESKRTFELINFEIEEMNSKSMFYDIFQKSDCITEFIPDSLLIINIYPNRFVNPLYYFALYKYGEKECEFNYPRYELKENIILYNKKYFDYLLGKLVKGAIIPYYERIKKITNNR